MTVQAIANGSVINGQDFYRFKKCLDAQIGSVSEDDAGAATAAALDISTKAITIGPDSSFDRYIVYYYNPATNFSVDLGFVSTNRPWIGRLDAFVDLDTQDNRGKIYVAAANNFATDALITDSVGGTIFCPVFDIIAYTTDKLASLTTQNRSPEFIDSALFVRFPGFFPTVAFFYPNYGRNSFDLDLYTLLGEVAFPLVTEYSINGIFAGDLSAIYRVELKSAAVVDQARFHYESTSNGQFDYIELRFIRNAGPQNVNDPQDFDHGGLRAAFKAY